MGSAAAFRGGIPGPTSEIVADVQLFALCPQAYVDPCPPDTWERRAAAINAACCAPAAGGGHRRLQGASVDCRMPEACAGRCPGVVLAFHEECAPFEAQLGLMGQKAYQRLLARCAEDDAGGAATAGCTSARSCAQLGWPLERDNDEDAVCAESEMAHAAESCVHADHAAAAGVCAAEGARLCTLEELDAGETHGTGCAFDVARTWTASAGACAAGQHSSAAGNSARWATMGPECTPGPFSV